MDNSLPFTVYPNPTVGGMLTVSVDAATVGELPFVVNIFDATGKLVYLSSMQDLKTFDISRLDGGFYILKICNGRDSGVQKVIINR
jgi:hypothetical protein